MVPISPVYSGRATRNRWRHYERWRTPLGRFIALADAACSFNPRFGQGMSAATVSARLLQQCLVRYGVADSRLPRAFFAAQARFQQTPWLFAAADDLRLPMSEGNRSLSMRLFNWYRPQLVTCPDPRGERSARPGDPVLATDVIAVRTADRLARAGRVDQPEDQGHPAEASIAVRCSDAARCRVIGIVTNGVTYFAR